MEIKVLGSGCCKCRSTIGVIELAAQASGVDVEIIKVENPDEIRRTGVRATPAVMIDGRLVHSGCIPSHEEVQIWLKPNPIGFLNHPTWHLFFTGKGGVGKTSLSTAAALTLADAGKKRQAEVAKLGADLMPFSLKATTHIFTKTVEGGIQRVVAKNVADAQQVKLVREHLRDIQTQFLKGDFSGPTHIHGAEMPGLAELKAAKPGQVAIDYRDVHAGAELTYRTSDAQLVVALHQWFDAQLSDHGADAMAGHHHHDHGTMMSQ